MQSGLFGQSQPDWSDLFEKFWAQGIFRKLGKHEARRHLRTTVKTAADWELLEKAHSAYIADLKRYPRPLMHGSTFARQWQDFLHLAPVETPAPLVWSSEEEEEFRRLKQWMETRR